VGSRDPPVSASCTAGTTGTTTPGSSMFFFFFNTTKKAQWVPVVFYQLFHIVTSYKGWDVSQRLSPCLPSLCLRFYPQHCKTRIKKKPNQFI
jgi:hypothetical protein